MLNLLAQDYKLQISSFRITRNVPLYFKHYALYDSRCYRFFDGKPEFAYFFRQVNERKCSGVAVYSLETGPASKRNITSHIPSFSIDNIDGEGRSEVNDSDSFSGKFMPHRDNRRNSIERHFLWERIT